MASNVLFLHTSSTWMRGSEYALLTLLRGLNRRKITPLLCSGNREFTALARTDGIETSEDPIPEIMIDGKYVKLNCGDWVRALRRALLLIKRNKIRLIYCNGGSTCQVGYYAAKIAGIPVVCHLHSPYNRRYILLYRLHRASKVIFVSKAIERTIRGKQRFSGGCEVVYNGVDIGRFKPVAERDRSWRERLSLPQDSTVFGQVSSLIPRKGIDVLLRAFQIVNRQNPKSRLVLVGDGPQLLEYMKLSRELNLMGLVSWAGNQADPGSFYRHVFDVNVLASRSDALPLSLLEAAACGLPNIGAMVDGIPECVHHGETGLVFEAENHTKLADAMCALISAPNLCREFGEAGRRLIEERFSVEQYCQSIENIILEQIERRPIAATGEDYAY